MGPTQHGSPLGAVVALGVTALIAAGVGSLLPLDSTAAQPEVVSADRGQMVEALSRSSERPSVRLQAELMASIPVVEVEVEEEEPEPEPTPEPTPTPEPEPQPEPEPEPEKSEEPKPAAPAGQSYNVGPVKPHVQAAANEIGTLFGVSTIGGVANRSGPSDHPLGLALDFMVGQEKGDAIAAYVVEHASRLRVTYVIWAQRINSLDGRGWRWMEDRGGATANHYDHVHVSFAP